MKLPKREDCVHGSVCKFDDGMCALECGHFAERSDNSDYAKLPNYVDIANISGVRPSDIKKVCDAIKQIGNFA